MRNLIVGVSLLCAASGLARADQCQVVDADAATAALALLKDAPTILSYCEPCNDPMPARPPTTKPTSAKARTSMASGQTIAINGKDVDLAYTYVQTGKSTWTNLGLMVGCGASNVTGFVTIGGTAKVASPPAPPPALAAQRERLARLQDEARELDVRVNRAMEAVMAAQTASDRSAAKAKLDALRKEKTDLDARIAAANAEAAKAERAKGTKIPKECLNNPLAKGCS